MTTDRLNQIFSATRGELIPLIKDITSSSTAKAYKVPAPLQGGDSWSVEKQTVMCKEIAQAIGFDFEKGRLDVSVHPFTGGSHPTDTRITTRYSSGNWLEGVGGTIHEVIICMHTCLDDLCMFFNVFLNVFRRLYVQYLWYYIFTVKILLQH
jgi:carboxypeptidase Taq